MKKSVMELIKDNVSDPKIYEEIFLAAQKRARITAIVLASCMITALLAVVFAFVQKTVASTTVAELSILKEELRLTKAEAEKQAAIAIETRVIGEEAAKLIQEQLDACRKGKK